MSSREKQVLLKVYPLQGETFSAIVKALREEIPESSLKYILKKFRSSGLLNYGDGRELFFTPLGDLITESLRGCSLASRALGSRPRGRGFKSRQPHYGD